MAITTSAPTRCDLTGGLGREHAQVVERPALPRPEKTNAAPAKLASADRRGPCLDIGLLASILGRTASANPGAVQT